MELSTTSVSVLYGLIFIAAVIYSSVGHAGASGYVAAMALFGLDPLVMKPTALTLNILVASFATLRLQQARFIRWRALLPLLAGSVPCAFLGGAVQVPGDLYRTLIGLVLIVAALKLFFQPRGRDARDGQAIASMPVVPAAMTGALIGLLSGLTGTGGGIFLTPLLLFFGWAGARQAVGLTAPFILANSVAGLAGNLLSLRGLPPELPLFAIAAMLGAVVGTHLGIRWLSPRALQRVLAMVLLLAACKFLLT